MMQGLVKKEGKELDGTGVRSCLKWKSGDGEGRSQRLVRTGA
jgi:hypothetical protein